MLGSVLRTSQGVRSVRRPEVYAMLDDERDDGTKAILGSAKALLPPSPGGRHDRFPAREHRHDGGDSRRVEHRIDVVLFDGVPGHPGRSRLLWPLSNGQAPARLDRDAAAQAVGAAPRTDDA